MFRSLNAAEAARFRQWARDNYKPGDPINPLWHPAVKAEAEVMNDWCGTTRIDPCPCECNRGGFCGGCGHAGCSGGINVRRTP